jgi:hypothetical protein
MGFTPEQRRQLDEFVGQLKPGCDALLQLVFQAQPLVDDAVPAGNLSQVLQDAPQGAWGPYLGELEAAGAAAREAGGEAVDNLVNYRISLGPVSLLP